VEYQKTDLSFTKGPAVLTGLIQSAKRANVLMTAPMPDALPADYMGGKEVKRKIIK